MSRRVTLEDLFDVVVPSDPAMSPDGRRIAYVLRATDREQDRDEHVLWLVDTRTGQREQLTDGGSDHSPAWSPDGSVVAFVRKEKEATRFVIADARGGGVWELCSVGPGATGPVWSPDGTSIAFSAPDLAEVELHDRAPIEAERLGYRADGNGLIGEVRMQVHVVSATTGTVRQLTRGPAHALHPRWSPDGERILFTAAREPDGDLTAAADIHAVRVDAPDDAPLQLTRLDGAAERALWSRDGSAVLVIGTVDDGVRNSALLRVPLDGGAVTHLTADLDRMVMPGGVAYPGGMPTYANDGRTLLFCARDAGHTGLYAVTEEPGAVPRPLVADRQTVVSGLSAAAHENTCAVVVNTRTSFGEVAVVDLASGELRVLTDHTAALQGIAWIEPQTREFTVHDGTTIQGVLLRRPDAPTPGPLLLDVHGGPHNSWSTALDAAHLYHQVLAASGWTVLLVNPRGSDGRDEEFLRAARGAWGYADEDDLLDPIDTLVAEGIADPERLALCGYSYGGFMACHLTARTDRFACAVAGGVISDPRSFAGSSDMGQLFADHEFGELLGPTPIELADRVSTPTLILHGAADDRCPVAQAEQWFTALRAGDVPVRMVLYPDAAHEFIVTGHPSHRYDYNARIVAWAHEHVPAPRRPHHADPRHWQQRLAWLADRHDVPGAVLGVLRLNGADGADGTDADEPLLAAHGVLSRRTGVPVTVDSRFHVGSITKVWTATLAMRLVDDGLIDLDAPVRTYLPGVDLGSAAQTEQVTMRQLLAHSSGIDGDLFADTGRGDDCLARFVAEALPGVAPISTPGRLFSYCNSGFTLVGRVIEVVTGQTWDDALRDRVLAPLQLEDTGTLPDDALLGRVAVGHLGQPPAPTPVWHLPRSGGPAGAIWSSVPDLLRFVRMHLSDGRAADGTTVLSAAAVKAMQEQQIRVPAEHFGADAWALGWMLKDWHGNRVIGHDGGTIGQMAFLRIMPERGLALALLTNGGNGFGLFNDLFAELFAELADIRMPRPASAPANSGQREVPSHWHGTYGRYLEETQVGDDGLHVTMRADFAQLLGVEQVHDLPLHPTDDDDHFLINLPGTDIWSNVTFLDIDGTAYLHEGLRATPRTRP